MWCSSWSAGTTASSICSEFCSSSLFNTLDASHFWIALATFAVLLGAVWPSHAHSAQSRAPQLVSRAAAVLIVLAAVSGSLMLLKVGALEAATRLSYTAFDATLVAMTALAATVAVWVLVATSDATGRRVAGAGQR